MRDVERGRGDSVGVIFIVGLRVRIGFGRRDRSQTVSQEKAGGPTD